MEWSFETLFQREERLHEVVVRTLKINKQTKTTSNIKTLSIREQTTKCKKIEYFKDVDSSTQWTDKVKAPKLPETKIKFGLIV